MGAVAEGSPSIRAFSFDTFCASSPFSTTISGVTR